MRGNNQNTIDCIQTGYLSLNKNSSISTHTANELKNLKGPIVGIWITGLSKTKENRESDHTIHDTDEL